MKIKDIREVTSVDLDKRIKELKHELLNLRIQKQTGQLENPARITNIRKEVARMSTVISERKKGINKVNEVK